ncbi:hypothetical protein QCA50_019800 [Cerrena zonata]|uniref:Uncharacterized protein n=1 Tax=Cerrena zonata TaxID=2478898 RepID=A0AAW0FIM8_9APHY
MSLPWETLGLGEQATWLLMDDFQGAYWAQEFWVWLTDANTNVVTSRNIRESPLLCRPLPTEAMPYGLCFTREEHDQLICGHRALPRCKKIPDAGCTTPQTDRLMLR